MKRLLLISGLGVVGLLILTNGAVLASAGIDQWQAFLMTQKAIIDAFKVAVDALIELYKTTL